VKGGEGEERKGMAGRGREAKGREWKGSRVYLNFS